MNTKDFKLNNETVTCNEPMLKDIDLVIAISESDTCSTADMLKKTSKLVGACIGWDDSKMGNIPLNKLSELNPIAEWIVEASSGNDEPSVK